MKASIRVDFEFAMPEFAESDDNVFAEERMGTGVAIFADDCGSAALGFWQGWGWRRTCKRLCVKSGLSERARTHFSEH